MTARIWNNAHKEWEYAEGFGHDGEAWNEILESRDDEAVEVTSFFAEDSYVGRGTILQRGVADMPIESDSDAKAQFMRDWSPWSPNGAWGSETSLNTSSFGTQPIHSYVVNSFHPEMEFQEWNITTISTPAVERSTYMQGQVPMASWMIPAQNGDRGIAVYDRSTGIMREVFMAIKNGQGIWTGSGGYSVASPGLRNLAEDNYALQQRRGISNVAGMHNSIGFIGISEVLNKQINHALCFTFGAAWSSSKTYPELLSEYDEASGEMSSNWPPGGGNISYPARAADGKAERYIPESTWTISSGQKSYTNPTPHLTPTHGQWGRVKDDVDPMFNPETRKPYKPLTRIIIEAGKKYGIVGTDTNLWCNAFNAEQGRTFARVYGEDPWKQGGLLDKSLWEQGTEGAGQGLNISDFPWHRTEWAPVDWGRPSPDMNIRPGEVLPWMG